MSTDFETQLRRGITAAGDRAPVEIDLDAVIDDGTRTLRRRTRRRAAVAGTLAAVALAGGAGALQMSRPHAAPAAPTVPSASPTAVILDSGGEPAGQTSRVRVEVTGQDGDGTVRLRLTPLGDQLPSSLRASDVVLPAGRPSLMVTGLPLCRYCAVDIVRGRVTQLTSVSTQQARLTGNLPGMSSGDARTVGPVTVRARWEAAAGPGNGEVAPNGQTVRLYDALLWRGPEGALHDSRGSTVASVDVATRAGRVTVFADQALDTFGELDASGSWVASLSASRRSGPARGYSAVQGGQALSISLLPAGARLTGATWAHARNQDMTTRDLPGYGPVAVMTAEATSAKVAASLVDFTYVTAQGRTVTVK